MSMPFQPWRAALLPASFGGAQFHVEAASKAGGRRIALHEYPKRDQPYAEDMGRKARRWPVTGYIIGPNYLAGRDALVNLLEAEGPFELVLPSTAPGQAVCDTYSWEETREKGGFVTFQMQFVEAGDSPDNSVTDDTQAKSATAASNTEATASSTLDTGLKAANNGFAVGPI